MDERARFVVLAQAGKEPFASLCRQFGISRKTGYKWLQRYEESQSLTQLADHSRRPANSPGRTAGEIEARVVALRQQWGWGARKLQVLLEREGIHLGETTINRMIKRNDLLREEGAHRPATGRYERSRPNELWQMDFKGPIPLEDGQRCYPLVIIDDHSRYLIGLFALRSTQMEPTLRSLRSALQQYGLPDELLTDHGAPFWGTNNLLGLTQIAVELMNQGVKMIHGAVRHPQTQGKVERANRTLQDEMCHHGTPRTIEACTRLFAEFKERYNHQRPHEALGMAVPADRYLPSTRAYAAEPSPWEYGPEMSVARLNTRGCLEYENQRLYVCEALAHQWVGLLRVRGKLVVQFRELAIREISLDTRSGLGFRR